MSIQHFERAIRYYWAEPQEIHEILHVSGLLDALDEVPNSLWIENLLYARQMYEKMGINPEGLAMLMKMREVLKAQQVQLQEMHRQLQRYRRMEDVDATDEQPIDQ